MHGLRSLVVLLAVASLATAADWPQWLGPNRDGASPETVTPWKEAPKVLWRQPFGEGYSSPVVVGGRVFLHARVKDQEAEEVVAFDAVTGKQLWRDAYPRMRYVSALGSGPRATPVVVVDRVYTYGITGILTCYQA